MKKPKRRDPAKKPQPQTKRFALGIGITLMAVVAFFALTQYRQQPNFSCANTKTCESDLSEKIENGAAGTFLGRTILAPTVDRNEHRKPPVLGTTNPSATKHIYVDLSVQKLFAYEGQAKIFETYVSTGRWGKTPTGNFHIWSKLRSTRMAGGSGSDAYDLPNVPFVMYFYRDFGLHGAYWHDNFGHTMSHGCVNLRQIDAEVLFNWADGPSNIGPGTAVSVCDRFIDPNTCLQEHPVQ